MTEESEIKALVNLLDDSDEEVVKHVTDKLLSYGKEVIPYLEEIPISDLNPTHYEKIEDIKHKIHLEEISDQLQQWAEEGGKDLFEGAYLIAKYKFPDLDKEALNQQIDRIKLDVWIELNHHLTPLEKIKKVNHVLYNVYGFKGDVDDYHAPANSYLNRVIEYKKGNPISLAIIYSILCQRLGIAVFGVNLPQHYILAYKDRDMFPDETSMKGYDYLEPSSEGDTLFYINAFNKGTIFSKWNIDQFLKQMNLEPIEQYYEPCSNIDTIMRVCRNLIFSYENLSQEGRSQDIAHLLEVLEPYSSHGKEG